MIRKTLNQKKYIREKYQGKKTFLIKLKISSVNEARVLLY